MPRPSLLAAFALALVSAACGLDDSSSASGRPTVVAAFYPLAFATERIAGELASVENLTPPGAEPHDLELTPSQVGALGEADLVVFVGGGFQPAVEDALAAADPPAADVFEGGDAADPHVWLDPLRMARAVDVIAERLQEVDPGHAADYAEGAAALVAELRSLDGDFSRALADCRRREIVVSHAAFGYLADRYNLEQVGIAGIDPEVEPEPQRLAQVAEYARRNNVTVIFFETLVSPRVAETLADEIGVGTDVLDPLEGAPDNGDYFHAMRANLHALERALDCDG